MFDVTVSASTSNIGSGFDVVGMALSLFNTYRFEAASSYGLKRFDKRFSKARNLVLKAYQLTVEMLGKDPVLYPVIITELKCEIPVSRGLGSSSACIVAGVHGAFRMVGEALDKEKIMTYATTIEGHPDNVAAVVYGGLVTILKTKDGWLVTSHPVDVNLRMILLVPDIEIKTKDARAKLPKAYVASDVTYALSRAIVLPYAFKSGDLSLIGHVFDDLIHEPYRYPLIPKGKDLKELILTKGGVVAISGSGPTFFVVSQKMLDLTSDDLDPFGPWRIYRTDVFAGGVEIGTLKET